MSAPSNSVTASIPYFVAPADGSRPYQEINSTSIAGVGHRNWTNEFHDVAVENLRGKEAEVTLDTAGFQLFNRPTQHKAFTDYAEIEREYCPESIELIKELTGASRVVLFDHTVRRRRPDAIDDHVTKRQPVSQAHIDQTPISAVARVHRHLPAEDVPALLQKRFQVINLWRPINNPSLDWPLALCDFRSVDPEKDVVPVALIYPDREGETYGVRYNPQQRWGYFRGVTPDELILIKCFDSVRDGSVALFAPHTAFADPTTPEGTPLRESIELRALVFYD